MNRRAKLVVPRVLTLVVVSAATLGSWVGCHTEESDPEFCIAGPDAGPHQKCPDMPDAGVCPVGCEVV